MTVLLIFAFLSGLVTIFAPCIWPLLPIVLSSSAIGRGHRRPLGITLGILISFGLLTLSISYLVRAFDFDPEIFRYIAVVILIILGLILIVPFFSRVVEGFVSRIAGRFGNPGIQNNDFLPGFLTGLSLGVVWTPCAGPILATIATLSATRNLNIEIILVTLVYLIGVGIPLFFFAYAGQRIISKTRLFNKYTGVAQKIFGVIILLTALLIFTNYDKFLQAKLLDAFPSYATFLNDLEGNDVVKKELNNIKNNNVENEFENNDLFNQNIKAPEFVGITNWLNTQKPLLLSELRGKAVLIDFWTYTCINCIRTLPHVVSWYENYKDRGLVVIGVHTPEFEFEKKTENVENALKQYKINYPVAQDNNYGTWNAYSNQYWPAKYLIDKNGFVRRVHFGEGEYKETELAIQKLLGISDETSEMPDMTPTTRNTPEAYLGFLRMNLFYPNGAISNGTHDLTLSKNISLNYFSLGGKWEVANEYSKTMQNSVLEYHFIAKNVYLVMRPGINKSAKVKVFLDGKPVDSLNAGVDVSSGIVIVDKDRLYELVNLDSQEEHTLRLEFETSGVEVFAFTFG